MFTDIVKPTSPVKFISSSEQRREVFQRLGAALERIPGFKPLRSDRALPSEGGPAGWFEFQVGKRHHRLQFVVLPAGYPKRVHTVMEELQANPLPGQTPDTYTVLVASWFSPETVTLCAERGYGTLDFSGNYRLHFGHVFLERVGAPPPASEQRQAASVFAPKSARILRALLAVPEHTWKVTELTSVTGVSAGLVSRVRQQLLERQWVEEVPGGIRLLAPEPLLSAWAEQGKDVEARLYRGYTLLHGQALGARLLRVMQRPNAGEQVIAAGVSAAQWMAPFLRESREQFYVTEKGFDLVRDELDLESQATGENIVLRVVEEPEVFFDRVQPSPLSWTTSPVQTYLDLRREGERGEEAAEHLRQKYLLPLIHGEIPAPVSPLRERLEALQRRRA